MKKFFKLILIFIVFLFVICIATNISIAVENNIFLPKVVIVTTGGTVAMKYDASRGGVVPALSGQDLMLAVPGLDKIANIEVVEFCNIDSSQMTPEIWRELSARIQKILENSDVQGVVVTHGTDTMEEGAFFLETTLKNEKPVVFVGSMRSASDLSPDGPANIYNAVLQICSSPDKGWGVTVSMNQFINSARHVRKDETTNVHTFNSGEYGYLGYIVDGQVICFNNLLIRTKLPLPDVLPTVPLITTYAGDDGELIRYFVDKGIKGLVVEGVGAGNVNKKVFDAIKYALSKNVAVVVASRVRYGGVYALYGDEGGGSSLINIGAYLAGDLSSGKARLLLMIALAQPDITFEKLKKLFS
jgi:L-asparaginase